MSTVTDEPRTGTDPDLEAAADELLNDDGSGYDGDLTLEGSTGQLSFAIGGKQPTSSSLRLMGGKVKLEGQFQKGERVVLHVEAVVFDVGFKDETDSKTGQTVGCERHQRARITAVERV